MEELGLVFRTSEGRCNRVRLTETGRRLYRKVVPKHEALIQQRFASLSDGEMKTLRAISKKLLE